MRTEVPSYKTRMEITKWSYARDKRSSWERRHAPPTYPGLMSKTRRRKYGRNLPEFSKWLKQKLDDLARAEGKSLRRLIEDSGANRANLYRWMKLTNDMEGPLRDLVDRDFDRLGIPEAERAEPYGYLGWNVGAEEETLTALEGKIQRVNAILRMKTLTPAQRAKYEVIKESAESSAEALMDRIINDFERDEAQSGD